MVLGVPTDVWKSTGVALVIGILILLLPQGVEYIEWLRQLLGEKFHWKEIVRDIGIAFLVAGIVSFIYEWSTRITAEQHKMTSVLQTVMSSFVPEAVWNEVNNEILHRMVARSNLNIQLRLYGSGEFLDGKPITLPPTQAVLWVKTSYDLYGLVTGGSRFDVTHYLDENMRPEEMDLPRFTRVSVTEAGSTNPIEYTGDKLNEVYDKPSGGLRLTDKHSVKLLPMSENKPTTIMTERYEIVNTPGLYTLVMPEMVIPTPKSSGETGGRPTITIRLLAPKPKGVEVSVYTWFLSPNREFKRKASTYEWEFDGVMLPGQGFIITMSVLPQPKPVIPTEQEPKAEEHQPTKTDESKPQAKELDQTSDTTQGARATKEQEKSRT